MLLVTVIFTAAVLARRSPCDMLTSTCNAVEGKSPPIVVMPPSAPTVEEGMAEEMKALWEKEVLGAALRKIPAALWATRTFGTRLRDFVVAAGGQNGSSVDESLRSAFITPKCDAHNTGYVGAFLPAIKRALSGGNIREVWALAYVLTKSGYLSAVLSSLLSAPGATPDSVAGAINRAAGTAVVDASAVGARWALMKQTAQLNSSEGLHYAQGVPDFGYESFDSWVRLDFDATTIAFAPLWSGARASKVNGCSEVDMMSDDPSIAPPLSKDELAYQCNETAPPCKLHWYPGALCYDVLDKALRAASGEVLPGYAARARALSYRTAAAASGTTANMLQYASLMASKGTSSSQCASPWLRGCFRQTTTPFLRSCLPPT